MRGRMSRVRRYVPDPAVNDRESETSPDAAGHEVFHPAARKLLELQATAGNGAVGRLLAGAQFKLTDGGSGDRMEREADSIAERIARAPGPTVDGAEAASADQPLPAAVRSQLGPMLGRDLSGVRVHADGAAAAAARAAGARAFTVGDDITFGEGEYAPGTAAGRRLLAHELAHTVQQADGPTPAVQRKEVEESAVAGPKDWTTADREGNSARWQAACLANLNALDSGQYLRVVERRDFYRWFYEYTIARGFTTRWAMAAYIVANGAHQVADMDVEHAIANDTIGLAGVELQGAMREGNQVIFDNVLPKLKRLLDGGPLKGRAALEWDMKVLSEEQVLIQPLYDGMSTEAREQMDYIARKQRFAGVGAWWTEEDQVEAGPGRNADEVPPFDGGSLVSVQDRWRYGMRLGDRFTPGGTGFDPTRDTQPPAGVGYWDASEFAKVATRTHLHDLDAWLNPARLTRMGPNSMSAAKYLQAIIDKLTAFEKQQVLADRSPDGWAYSTQFAQFGFITEEVVAQALPEEPAFQAAVRAFLARFAAAQARLQTYGTGMPVP
jgi:hypothetical protein